MSIRILVALCGAAMLAAALPSQASAQVSPSPYTTGYRYDVAQRVVGAISPDPDDGGPLLFRATRNSYDAAGRLTKTETGTLSSWQSETVAPSSWSGFNILKQVDIAYDAMGRKIREASSAGSVVYGLVQYSYDSAGQLECTAVRMNKAQLNQTTPACTLGTEGGEGPDRITRNEYFPDGRLRKVTSGYGLPTVAGNPNQPIVERANTYTNNGLLKTETDGENNTTLRGYDPFDRLKRVSYPSSTRGAGAANTGDYEEYDYDKNSNLVSVRRRDNHTIISTFDALNQQATKTVPATTNVAVASFEYHYDNLGHMTSASDGVQTITRVFDGFGRLKSETGSIGTVGYEYDTGSRRRQLTWPDGVNVTYEYDNTDALKFIRRAGSMVAADKIAELTYDNLGRRAGLSRGNSVSTTYSYDAALHLESLTQAVPSLADSVIYSFLYNPAGQITRRTITNTTYAWSGTGGDRIYAPNGLNQLTTAGGSSLSYGDGRGNMTSDGFTNWFYDVENHLRGTTVGATLGATATYDPMGRLYQTTSPAGLVTRYLYDGPNVIGEYDSSASTTPLRRYVHGAGTDEPLARYTGASTSAVWLLADHQGSIIAETNSAGFVLLKNSYDEYGNPSAGSGGLFQYTGQIYLPEFGVYHYKARAYSPTYGRFLQTDPVGYVNGLNWYAYVGNDPLNKSDPTGLLQEGSICATGDNCTVNGVDQYQQTFVASDGGGGGGGEKLAGGQPSESGWKKAWEICKGCVDLIGVLTGNPTDPPKAEDIPERPPAEAPASPKPAAGGSNPGARPSSPGSKPPPVAVPRPTPNSSNARWGTRDTLVVGGIVAGGAGVVCVLMEPCGAVVGAAVGLGGLGVAAAAH